jgi:hypothetical protein
MDRREALKKLALGGVAVVGGTGLIVGTAGAQRGGNGGGRPGTNPTPTPTPQPTPTPTPGGPIGTRLVEGSPAFVELLLFNGGRRAKGRFRLDLAAPGTGFHGWQTFAGGAANTGQMYYEQMSLDYVDLAIAGGSDLDVKGAFPTSLRDKTGSYTFFYWHGDDAVPDATGIYAGATYYEVTIHVVGGVYPAIAPFVATRLATPPTAAQL